MKLKQIRESQGLSQRKLSEISTVPLRVIQSYEQGYRDINTAQVCTIKRLSEALGCTIENLIE